MRGQSENGQPERPESYRRRGPWLDALRVYHARGYSAREIREFLNDAVQLLRQLRAAGHTIEPVSGVSVRVEPAIPSHLRFNDQQAQIDVALACLCREEVDNLRCWWTTRQVEYHLRQERELGSLPSARSRQYRDAGTILEQIEEHRINRVSQLGWHHLLPCAQTGPAEPGERRVVLDLTVTEAKVLSLLSEHGALATSRLAELLGRKKEVWVGAGGHLERLVAAGIVEVVDVRRPPLRRGRPHRTYRIAEWVGTHVRTRQPDGHEMRERRLKNAAEEAG